MTEVALSEVKDDLSRDQIIITRHGKTVWRFCGSSV